MPDEFYTFTERTYQRLADARINPLSVTDVLYGGAVVRRHIGAVLQVAGRDRHGQWLAIGLVEDDDVRYTVAGARNLDDDEIAVIVAIKREDES